MAIASGNGTLIGTGITADERANPQRINSRIRQLSASAGNLPTGPAYGRGFGGLGTAGRSLREGSLNQVGAQAPGRSTS
jgi:hypothetical protein